MESRSKFEIRNDRAKTDMRKILLIAKRDLAGYFASPMAYIVAAVFFIISSHFFYIILSKGNDSSLTAVFWNMSVVLLFIAPLLTMKLFAEERKLGTFELLRTSPLSSWHLVLGKYAAALGVYMLLLATTLVYVAIAYWVGKPELGILASGYLGMILIGAAWLAAGLYTSSLTDNQVVAAVVSFVLLLFLWILAWAEGLVEGWIGKVIGELSIMKHFSGFEKGVIDTSHIFYFIGFIFFFLFLSVRNLEAERWK